ncbi:MAG: UDP-glucose 4-epimerase GalE [Armatimonadetes bacterium]|nr:UDP-glucose 4-epimerase GalE [Armatimonadota bacterium]
MVLVLGGAGFVGSHVAKLLRRREIPHLVADNLENGHRAAASDSPFRRCDLRNPDDLRALFEEDEFDCVLLFAGYISVGESVREPERYFRNNVGGALNLLEAMKEARIERLIFSSSAAVYGEPQDVPIPEGHPTHPANPYGETKLAVERMLHSFGKAHGLRSISLRYFNAAGADPEGELGEDHRPEEHLIPLAIDAALGRREKLVIFGDDYDTPDGTCIRDFIHVTDLAEAHLLAMAALDDAPAGHTAFNLGSERGFSVKEVVDAVGRVCGSPVPHETGLRRPGDPARLVASCGRARKELEWEPRYSDLETVVRHAWEWRERHPDGYGQET